MAQNNGTNETLDPVLQPIVTFWSDYANQANESTRELLNDINEQLNLKSLQRRWHDAITKSMDAYMRSPMFLQSVKQHNDAAVKLKRQTDDWANEFARNANIPTTGDISGLFERLHSVEEVILKRLSAIDERLTVIEERISGRESLQPQ